MLSYRNLYICYKYFGINFKLNFVYRKVFFLINSDFISQVLVGSLDLYFNIFKNIKFNQISYLIIMCSYQLKSMRNLLVNVIFGLLYGWYLVYNMVGYNYSYKVSSKFNCIKLNLGYSRYKIFYKMPKTIRLLSSGRRRLYVYSFQFKDLIIISRYLNYLRNILPYKLRGLVLYDSVLSVLKQGKKVKYK